ncbi:terpenoid synthase [Penicillium brevicompactum]|uniref:(2E,6E)-farnesyl diphosphate synthase n=1 Tax=Penicillium brevicompactum TaxID=5074 RepID=A0A9W9R2B5_PENBR|nr:terpenoid synthase [Penicillium brevicompactum]
MQISTDYVNGASSREVWETTSHQVVAEPLGYLFSNPGKNIRSLLMDAFNEWLQVPEPQLNIIKEVVNILHTASLLIDDIQDGSTLRRGLPVAHQVFGTPQTINSANYAYFLAFKELKKLQNPAAGTILVEEMINLHLGQGMDLFWRDSSTCPTMAEYMEMVNNKTGGLFRIMIRLMQLEGKCSRDYVSLVEILGKLFQIRDDYKNLRSDIYAKQKGACDDITEGKFSFLIIHNLQTDPGSKVVRSILRQKTDNERMKNVVLLCLESTGSFEFTEEAFNALMRQAESLIITVDDGRGKKHSILNILKKLQI